MCNIAIKAENDLIIRSVQVDDAEILFKWWNDGSVMEHAGFPNGLGISIEECRKYAESKGLFIIEFQNEPIGEMSYREKTSSAVEIGIKICETSKQNKGFGTILLKGFINWLFEQGYTKIKIDTNAKNKRAQAVYEKIGFKFVEIKENSWKNQLGELQSSVHYEMDKV